MDFGVLPAYYSRKFGSKRTKISFRPTGKFVDHDICSALIILGALLVILLAAFGPFTQQTIRSFVCRVQVLPSNQASVPVAHYFNSPDDAHLTYNQKGAVFKLGSSMKSAILDAMTTKDDGTNRLDFTCPTGDCTFKPGPTGSAYASIGLCSECFDITSLVREWPGQDNGTMQDGLLNLTLEGLSAHNSIFSGPDGFCSSITSAEVPEDSHQDFGSQNITYLTYTWAPCTMNQTQAVSRGDEYPYTDLFYNWTCPTSSYPNIPHLSEYLAVLAVNCTFYPCIRNYNARVETGILRETPLSQLRMIVDDSDGPQVDHDLGVLLEPCSVDGQLYSRSNMSLISNATGHNFTTLWTPQGNLQAPTECVYRLSINIAVALSEYFRTAFFGNNQCWWDGYYATSMPFYKSTNLSWVTCPNEAWWLDSLFNRGFATFESVDSLIHNISLAVSNQMRAHGTNANWTAPEFASGTMWNSTVCTRVDWAWMALPFSLELITLVLLAMVITLSWHDRGRHPIWKSSTLPFVFHGIRDIKDALGNSEPPVSDASPAVSVPIDLVSMEKISKGLPVRLSTELGSSGFVVDRTSVHHRKSSTTHEATP